MVSGCPLEEGQEFKEVRVGGGANLSHKQRRREICCGTNVLRRKTPLRSGYYQSTMIRTKKIETGHA